MMTCPICHRNTVNFFGANSYKCSTCGIVAEDLITDKRQLRQQAHDSWDEEYGPILFGFDSSPDEFKRLIRKYRPWMFAFVIFLAILFSIIFR